MEITNYMLTTALRLAGVQANIVDIVGQDESGAFTDIRAKTGGGAHYHFKVMTTPNGTFVKSVLRIRNRNRPYTLMINGQGGRNTKTIAWWHDGQGPTIKRHQHISIPR